ncbi:ATP-binding protein [Kistimonas asteriae]|uniref:ATP-binding protein n=1 Tax=Kistimonas asteriae TaxID=517724 RepID=UPI001BA81806|nr:ATP-binding protein [Kistimonas asteriae]
MPLIESLKGRMTLAVASLLLLFLGLVLAGVLSSFNRTLDKAAREQLAANANAMLAAAAREENGQLIMPERLIDNRFNTPGEKLHGYIYDENGRLVWQSISTMGKDIPYVPDFNLEKRVTFSIMDLEGEEFLVYEIDVPVGQDSLGYSFVTVVPAQRYFAIISVFENHLMLWMSMVSLVILATFWLALWWSLKPFRRVIQQIREIEMGSREQLDGYFPSEVRCLTSSINTLLLSEKTQRERYRTTMDDLAHSLKTPLVVLQSVGNTLGIQDGPDRQSMPELRQTMMEQINRMNQIIGYHLHRAVTGRKGLMRQAVQVGPLVHDLCRTLDKVYRDKQVSVQVNLDAACLFHGDENDLLEILGNLLENAFKFCQQGVRIGGYVQPADNNGRESGSLVLVIEDDGAGLADDQREQVLQRGVRADCLSPGQGIGLAVVLDLVESYDGKLVINTSTMGGALFRLILP